MALGFAVIFLPALALEAFVFPSLANIVSGQTRPLAWQSPPYPPWHLMHMSSPPLLQWLAKAALNVWRLAGAAHLIYWRFLPRFGLERGEGQPAAAEQAATAAAADGGAGSRANGAAEADAEQPGDAS